jgi:hypothetical protein
MTGASNSKVFTNLLEQPLPVATDLITMRRFEAIVSTTPGGAPFTVSTKALIDTLPGTSTVWDKVQFHRFDVFSNDLTVAGQQATIAVTVTNPASGYFGDVPTGYADPAGTARRAHVAIAMNELFRETWIDSTDTSPLLTIKSGGTTTSASALVQFVCVLRSTAGALTGVRESEVRSVLEARLNTEPLILEAPVFTLSGESVLQTGPVFIRG